MYAFVLMAFMTKKKPLYPLLSILPPVSTIVMVAGTSVGFVQRISGNTRYNKAETVLKVIMGTAILLIGFYMFWLAF